MARSAAAPVALLAPAVLRCLIVQAKGPPGSKDMRAGGQHGGSEVSTCKYRAMCMTAALRMHRLVKQPEAAPHRHELKLNFEPSCLVQGASRRCRNACSRAPLRSPPGLAGRPPRNDFCSV